jgi:hypothetical protein
LKSFSPEIKNSGWHAQVVFTNISKDTLTLHNVVPLGENPERVYITGLGDHSLSRAHLFRPGFSPVNVILPDNAWELGYSEVDFDEIKIAALTRRASWENATRRRFETSFFRVEKSLTTFGSKVSQATGRKDCERFFRRKCCLMWSNSTTRCLSATT